MESSTGSSGADYVLERYQNAIGYYWSASRSNKRWYKITRYLSVTLGAIVTLVASLSSTSFIARESALHTLFALGTPVLAAMLAIVGGFSQSFQWGSTWKDMVLSAERLEKERDRFLVTPENQQDLAREMEALNNLILSESLGFFQRIVGGTKATSTSA